MKRKSALIETALESLASREKRCDLCPRDCRVDRTRSEIGFCGIADRAGVARSLLHYGEEPLISGSSGPPGPGSGTIFFTGCNLRCLFCQNFQISWGRHGEPVSDAQLADLMIGLQDQGALNINLVSPTHVVLPILRALRMAVGRGLTVPVVWNSNGFESVGVIERLAGIVDIYLPDLKYHSPIPAERFSGAKDYFEQASQVLGEMYVQQPDLEVGVNGIASRGLIVRHLVLPGQAEDSIAVLEWLARTLSPSIGLSLMSQYQPCFRAPETIRRVLRVDEYGAVLNRALELGFENLFAQPEAFAPDEHLMPDFGRESPFRWKPD